MDRGTNAVSYIRGDVIPLSLGYIGTLQARSMLHRVDVSQVW